MPDAPDAIEIAIIGGSGFYEIPGLSNVEDLDIETPFGTPSDAVRIGTLEGRRVAFLARHGRHHTIAPDEIPQRANVWALKSLGVRAVIGVSAVGSLQATYRPGDLVIPDQLFDRTLGTRPATFFGDGLVAHVSMADPFSADLRARLLTAAAGVPAMVHDGGTLVTIEGPQFGTRAESRLYQSWGIAIVGMTAFPEAKLIREAEMRYALLTAVTDFDSWNEDEADADMADIFATMQQNAATSQAIVRRVVADLELGAPSPDERCLDTALATPLAQVPATTLERLGPILRRRLSKEEQ